MQPKVSVGLMRARARSNKKSRGGVPPYPISQLLFPWLAYRFRRSLRAGLFADVGRDAIRLRRMNLTWAATAGKS